MKNTLYGGIEAGGTKFICAIGNDAGEIFEHIQIPTTSPEETIAQVAEFFRNHPDIKSIGVGSFGPIDLNTKSNTYGRLLNTPKEAWARFNLLASLKVLNVNISLETDVNCSAIGEYTYGAGKDLESVVYLTVGTGIGGSCIVGEKILKGVSHSEMGHMYVPRVIGDENFEGVCPYHMNCFEGLASGPSLQKRWETDPQNIPSNHIAWDIEAQYLAFGLSNLVTILMPNRIIIGGGVMNHQGLIESIQKNLVDKLSGYVSIDEITNSINDYIVLPQLGDLSPVVGAIRLASIQTTS
jgi:fructokinase